MMKTLNRLPTWQKVLGAAALVGGGWWLYSKQKKKDAKKVEVVPEEPVQPQEPTPENGLGGAFQPDGIGRTVKRRVYVTSDNQNMPAPVRVRMIENADGTFDVQFRYTGGMESFRHHTRQAADLRLESMVKRPSEWTNCTDVSYDSTFDAWICKAGYQSGDMVARGFHDSDRGPAPWLVTWDGDKFIAQFMADLHSAPQALGTFDDMFTAIQEASGA